MFACTHNSKVLMSVSTSLVVKRDICTSDTGQPLIDSKYDTITNASTTKKIIHIIYKVHIYKIFIISTYNIRIKRKDTKASTNKRDA